MFVPSEFPSAELTLACFREALQKQGETWETVIRLSPRNRRARALSDYKRYEHDIRRVRGIIDAMTPAEREFPFAKVDGWRVHRIAHGAGVDKSEVVELLESVKRANVMVARARLGRSNL